MKDEKQNVEVILRKGNKGWMILMNVIKHVCIMETNLKWFECVNIFKMMKMGFIMMKREINRIDRINK